MARTAEVVIIGGGIAGVSIAYHLARKGMKRVVVVEKKTLGSGATALSSACIRSNYSHPELVRMAKRAIEIMTNFEDLYGGSSGFRRTGYIAVFHEVDRATAVFNVAVQNAEGVQTAIISREEVRDAVPWVDDEGVSGAICEVAAGYAEPSFVVDVLARGARDMGVEFQLGTEVVDLRAVRGAVREVVTTSGTIETPIVVNAANAWAPGLAAKLGVHLPIEASRHKIGLMVRPMTCPAAGPIFVDMINQIYYRPDVGQQTLVGSSRSEELEDVVSDPDEYRRSLDQNELATLAEFALKRFPAFETATFRGGYAGFYDVTPDWQFILGPVSEVKGFYIAAGLSGHGFKHGPLIGQGMAELIMDGHTAAFDIGLFSLDRFSRGALIRPERHYTSGLGYR